MRAGDIAASIFPFTGIPQSIDAGRLAVPFETARRRATRADPGRKRDGIVAVFAEILALPPEDEAPLECPAGGLTSAEVGQRNGLILDLEPGGA